MRKITIKLRATPGQRQLIDQAARQLDLDRSDFILDAACERAQSALLNQVFFRLDDARFAEFKAQLEKPIVPNPGLQKLRAVVAPWLS